MLVSLANTQEPLFLFNRPASRPSHEGAAGYLDDAADQLTLVVDEAEGWRLAGDPDDDLAALYRGGYLHDIGKIGIPDAVLQKPEKLSDAEFDLMKQHTIIGDRLCGELRSLRRVRRIVRHHHGQRGAALVGRGARG